MAAQKSSGLLAQGAKGLAVVAGKRMLSTVTDRIGDVTGRLTDFTENGGGQGLMSAITGKDSGKADGSGKKLKVTNIVEWVDVGVPIRLAYDQWTQFTEFPSFTKKVESVEQEEDTKLKWRAQVLWSHRSWESTIIEQVPDKRIVWRSDGDKGSVDGAVTFHELGPELTRICLVLEYHPQGFMEHTGNLWRAPGRRARLEFKHIVRHMMTEAILHPDDIQGWRGEIHDGEVVKDDEQARAEEEEQAEQARGAESEGGDEGRSEESRRREDRQTSRRAESGRSSEQRPKAGAGRRSGDDDRTGRRPSSTRGRDREDMKVVSGGRG